MILRKKQCGSVPSISVAVLETGYTKEEPTCKISQLPTLTISPVPKTTENLYLEPISGQIGQVKDETVKAKHSMMPSMCLQPSSMTIVNPKNRGVKSLFACKKLKSIRLANSHDEKKKISILPTPETSTESNPKISSSPVPNTKTSRVIDGKNTKFSKVSEIVQTNEVAMSIDIPQNQEVLVLTENVAQEVQTATAVNPDVHDISASGENSVQNVTMEYQDINGKNIQKKFSVYQKAPVSFTFKNALVLVQYNEKASTNQINEFYRTFFPYYSTAADSWKNNARRNLSEKNGYFKKTGEAATKIKGQRGPQGERWTFSDKKEKLKEVMTKAWKESEQDIKSSTPFPDLVETLFKKVLALKTSGVDTKITKKCKRQKQCLTYDQLAVLAIKDGSKNGVIVDDVFKFCEKLLSYYKDKTDKDWTKNVRSVIAKMTKQGLFVAKGKNGEKSYTLAPEKKESEYRKVLEFCQKNEAKIKSKMCDPEMFENICK